MLDRTGTCRVHRILYLVYHHSHQLLSCRVGRANMFDRPNPRRQCTHFAYKSQVRISYKHCMWCQKRTDSHLSDTFQMEKCDMWNIDDSMCLNKSVICIFHLDIKCRMNTQSLMLLNSRWSDTCRPDSFCKWCTVRQNQAHRALSGIYQMDR